MPGESRLWDSTFDQRILPEICQVRPPEGISVLSLMCDQVEMLGCMMRQASHTIGNWLPLALNDLSLLTTFDRVVVKLELCIK